MQVRPRRWAGERVEGAVEGEAGARVGGKGLWGGCVGGGGERQDGAGEDEGKLLKRGKGVPGNLFSSARFGPRVWKVSGG